MEWSVNGGLGGGGGGYRPGMVSNGVMVGGWRGTLASFICLLLLQSFDTFGLHEVFQTPQ